jgi:hypothetical protein
MRPELAICRANVVLPDCLGPSIATTLATANCSCTRSIRTFLFAVITALLLISGPLFIACYFASAHRYGAAFLTGALWLLGTAVCIRDYRRKKLSWVSGGILAIGFVLVLVMALVIVFAMIFR